MSSWWNYVTRTAKTDVQKTMAADTGISETAFSRWKRGANRPEAPHVITFARAYGRPPVEALVAANILKPDDVAAVIEVHNEISAIADDDLLAEVGRRMKGQRHAMETPQKPPASPQGDKGQEVGSAVGGDTDYISDDDFTTVVDSTLSDTPKNKQDRTGFGDVPGASGDSG